MHTQTKVVVEQLRAARAANQAVSAELERVVEIVAGAPARTFGLAAKGRLDAGADADVAIVDPERELEIRDEDVLSRIDWTPYAGRRVHGVIETTLMRGHEVFRDGAIVGQPGWGRQARPSSMASGLPVATHGGTSQ